MFKKILTFTVVAGAVLLGVTSCSCSSCSEKNGEPQVPEKIIKAADELIISKTGKKFFDNHIYPDYSRTRKVPAGYAMFYTLTAEGKDYINEDIQFIMDSTGNVRQNYDIKGIPNCKDEPEECLFTVSKNDAIEIARQNGVDLKGKEDAAEFRWSAELGRYIWHILVTTKESGNKDRYRAEGYEIMIDPGNGSVIKQRDWKVN